MRALILISGIIISGVGAFCFAFYTSTFSDVAFLVGLVMFIAGICNTIAYLISGKGNKKLTETTLVEGIVTLLYGFAVLNNQVTESSITMFFGTWLTLCGVTRFSQSLYVSRFNARDWSKILPLAVVASILGMLMMMPWIVASVASLMLVGGAFLLDGFSMIVYSMYMKDSSAEMADGEAKARARAEAKKIEHEAAVAERERVRSLSEEERQKEEKERREKDLLVEEERIKKRLERKNKRREAARPIEERTLKLSDEEVAEINMSAEDMKKEKTINPSSDLNDFIPLFLDDDNASAEEELISSKPVWNKPEFIPSVRDSKLGEKKEEAVADTPVIAAVNLREFEDEPKTVEFEQTVLPEVEFASDKESADRDEIIKSLDSVVLNNDSGANYEKIDLDDLLASPAFERKEDDSKFFTQTLDFSWVEKVNAELNKQDNLLGEAIKKRQESRNE